MEYGISEFKKPKRSLGQNFFTNPNLGKFLIEKVLESNPEDVIEIGGGKGFFTKFLVEKNVNVTVIEKDDALSKSLEFLFPNIKVYNEDLFSKNILKIFQKTKNTVCFGSLPYNISKKIIHYLAVNSDIKDFYFIIQKEVAERYFAKKKNSFLSISTELYFDVKIICNIAPENFKPRPNVTSSFVKFSRNEMNLANTESFLEYLHRAFKQPRKKLKNNLQKYYQIDSINLDQRAEDLSVQEHLKLYKDLKPKGN